MLYNCAMPNGEELSEREREILRLVATGVSNKEIAQALSISPNTVKVHMRNIFAKIEVVSRTEATLYALKTGLITSPAPPVEELPREFTAAEDEAQSAPDVIVRPNLRLRWLLAAALIVLVVLGIAAALRLSAGLPLIGTLVPTPAAALPQRWVSRASLPQPLSAPAVAVFEQSAYVLGGSNLNGTSAATWQYNLMNDTWNPRAAKPTPVDLAGAVLIGETIYVPGGRNADGKPTAQLEIYLPRSNEWQTRASLPQALYAYGLAAYEGQLYLFGGWDGSRYYDSVYIYDPETDTWKTGQKMAQPRAHLAAVTASGKILVMGGTNETDILDNNSAYYPQRDQNGEPAWEERSPLPEARHAFGAAFLVDGIYVIGGLGKGETEPASVIYNVAEDNWSGMEQRKTDPQIPANGAFLAAVPWQTTIHVFGGAFSLAASDQHVSYQAMYTVSLPVLQNGGE